MLQSQSAVQSSEFLQAPGVIQSLERVRDRVKEQLIKVPEYRALLAIETSIAEVSNIPDLVAYVESAKEKIMDRLRTFREFQAMVAVEKSIIEISEVLGVLAAVAPETPTVPQTEVDEPTPSADEEVLKALEAVSPLDAAGERLARVLGLTTDEPIVNQLS
jgi:hypothetical protein